ncbi:MAG: transglycosylase domain-containing protein [Eubacteriaceae bacterium]|nr:transglycosylase domain-containing protein [Eubacteriaceae bacterium]
MKKAIKSTFIASFIAGLLFLAYMMASVPNISAYSYAPSAKTKVTSSDGIELGSIERKNSVYASRDEIPDDLVFAVVAVEDKRFFTHFGVDILGIGRALVTDLFAGRILEGASTITQQTATLLFFNKDKTYIRKIREALTAVLIERKYTKDEIISMYLNEVYFGAGAYGINKASEIYFSKKPKDLSLEECAMLAGIIQAPYAYAPLNEESYKYAAERKNKALRLMFEQGYITQAQCTQATESKVIINPSFGSSFEAGSCKDGLSAYMNRLYKQALIMLSEHYEDTVGLSSKEAAEKAEEALFSGTLSITATLAYSMQQTAYETAMDHIEGNSGDPSSAFVFINSSNGNVLAYYGSNTYVDMAQKPRQPGSTIKPLYYSYLIENGIATRNTVVNDERFEYNGYSPNNIGSYNGYVTMREALSKSLNAASLRFFEMAPLAELVDSVKAYGITTIYPEDYTPAFALGGLSRGISPLELAGAYSAFANGGTIHAPNYIDFIVLPDATLLFPSKQGARTAISEQTASQIKSCLESAVLNGTATAAQMPYSTMGKTGTTDNSKDVWFAGSTGEITGAVWFGNIDTKQVPGISTAWSMKVYKEAVLVATELKNISKASLIAPRTEELVNVSVCIHMPEALNSPIDESCIASVAVPTFERGELSSIEIVESAICLASGDLYNSRNCPPSMKSTNHYLKGRQPSSFCRSLNHKLP